MSDLYTTHDLEPIWGTEQRCTRCHMCSCHSLHKLAAECERVDGRKKESDD